MKTHERSGSDERGIAPRALVRVGAIAMLPLAAMLALSGCGGGGAGDSSSQAAQQDLVVHPPQDLAVPAQAAASGISTVPGGEPLIAAGEAVSPDVTVSVADTLVSPGETVEITARATGDAKQLVLWDGIHDRQAFAYDSTTSQWRATYRVPLRPAFERVGLSVTAKNDSNRWRRVWIFLHVEQPEAVAAPESQQP